MSDRYSESLIVDKYERIIVFNNKKDFEDAISGHDFFIPLIGNRPTDEEQFPGVFIAGWL